jgi:mono/diheme cytochrome c family protein
MLHAQVPVEVGSRDWTKSLPDGEGKGLVLGTCTQCHSLNPVVFQRKTTAQWEHTVQDMSMRGAQIRPDELAPITAYLARYFGPGAPSLTASGTRTASFRQNQQSVPTDLPEDAGKALVLSACTGCHGIETITEQSKDKSGWQASVNDMVRLGAKLQPEEEPAVIAYLVKHFGRQIPTATGASTKKKKKK